jgi:hypothetical protein
VKTQYGSLSYSAQKDRSALLIESSLSDKTLWQWTMTVEIPSRSAVIETAATRYRLPTEGAERLSREHRRVRQAVRLRDRLNRQLPVTRIDPTEQSWLFIARAFQSAISQ